MQTEEFDYLIRRAVQAFPPPSAAEIELGWLRLLAASGGRCNRRSPERRQPYCVDLPGPHGQLAGPTPAGDSH